MMEKLARLIAYGADVNAANEDARTALHVAASQGHKSTCKCLLDAKADPTLSGAWLHAPHRFWVFFSYSSRCFTSFIYVPYTRVACRRRPEAQ